MSWGYAGVVGCAVIMLGPRCEKDIADGAFKVFTGPIKDQAGKVIIPAGKVATDGQLLGMDWFVQGVQGSTK